MSEKIEAAMQQLKDVYHILAADIEAATALGRESPSPFAARTLFRAYFAFIEGLSHQFRRVALICSESDAGLLTPNELKTISDEINRAKFTSTLPALLLSIRCFARVWGATFKANTDDKGWLAMHEFAKMRNGLMHPKSVQELELTDDQFKAATQAAQWWKATVLQLLRECKVADETFS